MYDDMLIHQFLKKIYIILLYTPLDHLFRINNNYSIICIQVLLISPIYHQNLQLIQLEGVLLE